MSDARDPCQVFAANLLAARKQAGLTQAEVGSRCGLQRAAVSLIERAGREPRLETIVKLAAGLGIGVDALCEGIVWDAQRQRFRALQPHGRAGQGSVASI